MHFIDLSQCVSSLQIEDLDSPTVSPALHSSMNFSVAFENPLTHKYELIKKGNLFSNSILVFSSADLSAESLTWAGLMARIFPQMGLGTLGQIFTKKFDDYFSFSELLETYNIKPSENLNKILHIVSQLSSEHQQWISEKKFHVNDLGIFLVASSALISSAIQICKTAKASKSQSVSIIEWLCEWALINSYSDFSEKEQLWKNLSSDQLLDAVKKLRFPETTSRDLSTTENLKLHWPSQTRANLIRRGDRLGFDLQFFVSNPIELKKNLVALERVAQDWKE